MPKPANEGARADPRKALGRALDDFRTETTDSGLLPVEQRLLDAVARGQRCSLVDDTLLAARNQREVCLRVPQGPSDSVRVRGEFIRFLALGGDENCPVHEKGIELVGAYVSGELDLHSCRVTGPITLIGCRFEKPVNLRAAHVASLSLAGSHVPSIDAAATTFAGSVFLGHDFCSSGYVSLQGAQIEGSLECDGGRFLLRTPYDGRSALNAESCRVQGSVYFGAGFQWGTGFTAEGQVSLLGSEIGGQLVCAGGRFRNRRADGSGRAIVAQGARVKGTVFLRTGFVAEGGVSLRGIEIGGELDCSNGKFSNRTDDGKSTALDALSANIKGNVLLSNGFRADGLVSFRAAEIGGEFDWSDGTFFNPTGDGTGTALTALSARVKGNLLLDHVHARGQVWLHSCDIGGNLDVRRSRFVNVTRHDTTFAFNAYGIRIKGSVPMDSVRVVGGWSMINAEIGGDFECYASRFLNRTHNGAGRALDLSQAKIGSNIYFRNGTRALGQTSLYGAKIGADLDCSGATFINRTSDGQGLALSVGDARVEGSLLLCTGFRGKGQVSLLGAEIGGQLQCFGGHFSNPAPVKTQAEPARHRGEYTAENALQLQDVRVGDTLLLGFPSDALNQNAVIEGSLSLVGAHARLLTDYPDSWPKNTIATRDGRRLRCCIDLDGFTYDRLSEYVAVGVEERTLWLRRQPPDASGSTFAPQPYEQLVRVLRAMGREEDARTIAEVKQDLVRRHWRKSLAWSQWLTLGLIVGPPYWLYGRLAGYGYRPARLFGWLFCLWLACSLAYAAAWQQDAIVPANPEIFLNERFKECGQAHKPWKDCLSKIPEHPPFKPYVFSLELMLPVADLQQKKAWAPRMQEIVLGYQGWIEATFPPWTLWAVVWSQTVVGWIGSLVLAGVLTAGLFRKD